MTAVVRSPLQKRQCDLAISPAVDESRFGQRVLRAYVIKVLSIILSLRVLCALVHFQGVVAIFRPALLS